MGLYRANPEDGVAWITGASTGIGRSLALDLARQGYVVAATARDEERLATLILEAEPLRGRVLSFPCDVTEKGAMARTVAAVEAEAGPIVLAVFNAGSFFPTRGEKLDILNMLNTFELNLFGVIFGLVPAVERMRGRGRGQVVVVGSASAYFGWPSAGAYGGSKAALNNMAEALKHDFDRLNIRLQIINPGFVKTPLTARGKFSMPFLMPVERASARMAKAFQTGGFEINFPRRLTWPLKVVRMLPVPLRYWLVHKVTGWDKRPMALRKRPRY